MASVGKQQVQGSRSTRLPNETSFVQQLQLTGWLQRQRRRRWTQPSTSINDECELTAVDVSDISLYAFEAWVTDGEHRRRWRTLGTLRDYLRRIRGSWPPIKLSLSAALAKSLQRSYTKPCRPLTWHHTPLHVNMTGAWHHSPVSHYFLDEFFYVWGIDRFRYDGCLLSETESSNIMAVDGGTLSKCSPLIDLDQPKRLTSLKPKPEINLQSRGCHLEISIWRHNSDADVRHFGFFGNGRLNHPRTWPSSSVISVVVFQFQFQLKFLITRFFSCLLYTSDAADE